jgi:GT2 family glycosyltransferase
MRVSVVIPTHNRRASLRACLAAALAQELDGGYEVIVVDDASTDGTADMLAAEFPAVRVLRQAANRGPAAARNRGIQAARGAFVAFTDDDCRVPPGWLAALLAALERHPRAAGAGGWQAPPDELVRRNPVARVEYDQHFRRWGPAAQREQVGGYEVPAFGTNNAAYRRAALLELGGFDEGFPAAAGEDADLNYRLAQAGWQLAYLPFGVTHLREYTLRAQWRAARRRGEGAYRFEARHARPPGASRLALRLGKRLLLFLPDLLHMPPAPAAVHLLTRLGDWTGQARAAWRARHD